MRFSDNKEASYADGEILVGTGTDGIDRKFVLSKIWDYIAKKIASILGLTATAYKGNASSATKLATARTFQVTDSDGTNKGAIVSFDGTANKTLPLPSTIKATLVGNASTATTCTGNATTATTLGTTSSGYTKASLDTALAGKVPTTRTVNGHALNSDVTVTKADVGLGNVTNVATDSEIKSGSGNNITSGAVFTALSKKVDKVDGRGLSEQNYTNEEKTKLSNLHNYDDTALSARVEANESAIETLNADENTAGSVENKIQNALKDITQFDFLIVSELPETGKKGVIYLVKNSEDESSTNENYAEYIWINDGFEHLGNKTVQMELDEYAKKEAVADETKAREDADKALQTNIDKKQATLTGAATTIASANLTASRALVSDASGKVSASGVTSTQLGYLSGVTSAIQTQLDAKQAKSVIGNSLYGTFGLLGGAQKATSTNFADLMEEVSKKGGICGGSIMTTSKALGLGGDSIWYNFLYIPHRTGIGGDNSNYGTLLATEMTGNTGNLYIAHRITSKNYNFYKLTGTVLS